MRIAVVGKGILGLSIAEYLSRTDKVQVAVFSSENHGRASSAAAANLATKAQRFARDPHFALKLQGKNNYQQWLSELRREDGAAEPEELSGLYVAGLGRDLFADEAACAAQFRRVLQPPEQLAARALPLQSISRPFGCALEYDGEAWVHAGRLLDLLERVCRRRGVSFSECDAMRESDFLSAVKDVDRLVLAAGATTPQILSVWGVQHEGELFRKSRRWSMGATLEIENPNWSMPAGVSILEVVPAQGVLTKLAFSGFAGRLFCSSISVKCADKGFAHQPDDAKRAMIELQQKQLRELVFETFSFYPEEFRHQYRWGLRLGFGHSELLIESLAVPASFYSTRIKSLTVAAGAHKSGFLFAPRIGELVLQKVQHI
jgi:glycine/D-amino acid oxidase-like deaminating enzyme